MKGCTANEQLTKLLKEEVDVLFHKPRLVKKKKIRPTQFHRERSLYDWLGFNYLDEFLERYSDLYKGTLVDLGCGEAPYKPYFLQFVDKYVGVDWVESAQYKPDVISDLNRKIDLPDDFADTLISISVLEHLCEPQRFLNECFRILKKGGYMFIQVPWQWTVHSPPHDYFRYTPFALDYMLRKSGFIDIKVEPAGGIFSTIVLKLNYLSLRLIRGPLYVRLLVKYVLVPFWTMGQLFAPLLDKLDKRKINEAPGYFVIARKPF
ncbi:methyltransferase domain-containing protein [Fervidobacterium sp.]